MGRKKKRKQVQNAFYMVVLTVIRLIASLLADGINTERWTPANCNVRVTNVIK